MKRIINFIIGWIRHVFHKDKFTCNFYDDSDKVVYDYFKSWEYKYDRKDKL